MAGRLLGIGQYGGVLPGQVLFEQLAHAFIGDPVAGAHDGRREAARYLVLAAGARLEDGQPLAQAVVDPLVEAKFEVQAVVIAVRPPITAIEGVSAAEADRARAGDALRGCSRE